MDIDTFFVVQPPGNSGAQQCGPTDDMINTTTTAAIISDKKPIETIECDVAFKHKPPPDNTEIIL